MEISRLSGVTAVDLLLCRRMIGYVESGEVGGSLTSWVANRIDRWLTAMKAVRSDNRHFPWVCVKGLQIDVVYLSCPPATSYLPPRGGGGGWAGSQPMSTAVHRSPNRLWRYNTVFNLRFAYMQTSLKNQ